MVFVFCFVRLSGIETRDPSLTDSIHGSIKFGSDENVSKYSPFLFLDSSLQISFICFFVIEWIIAP